MIPLQIVESEFASAQLAKIYETYPHFEHYWERGITWILVRNPEKGERVPDVIPPRYVIRFNRWKKGAIPTLVVVYRYHEAEGQIELERVTLHD